jgi:hypothetical protein
MLRDGGVVSGSEMLLLECCLGVVVLFLAFSSFCLVYFLYSGVCVCGFLVYVCVGFTVLCA